MTIEIHTMVNEYKDDILIVNFAFTDNDDDAMSVAPRSDSPSLTGMDEGKHNIVTVELSY